MTITDELLDNNARYAEEFTGSLAAPPSKRVAVVACMDARLDVCRVLGLDDGQAHVLRNAGGVITDDMIRSLSISQRVLGTREIVLIHHTKCGMLGGSDAEYADGLAAETGHRPEWTAGFFADIDADVRASMARLVDSVFVPHTDQLRGFVFDIDTGLLREVSPA